VNAQVAQMNRETERLNEAAVQLGRGRDRFAEMFGAVPGQPAEFRDSRRTLGPFILSRTRGIDVFRFEDRNHLILVLARQLGYGLGLDTSDAPGSVMSVDPARAGTPVLTDDDRAALQALCQQR
jgi:hypothetical protein